MHYQIKVIKTPPDYNGGRKLNAKFVSDRGIFCKPENAGVFTKESANKWISRFLERKDGGFEFEVQKVNKIPNQVNYIRGELLPK